MSETGSIQRVFQKKTKQKENTFKLYLFLFENTNQTNVSILFQQGSGDSSLTYWVTL